MLPTAPPDAIIHIIGLNIDYRKKKIKRTLHMDVRPGAPERLGVTRLQRDLNFAAAVPENRDCSLLLYKKALPRLSRRFRLQKRCGLEMSVQFASVSFQQIHMNIITRSTEKLYRILMQCSLQEESTGEKDQRKAMR